MSPKKEILENKTLIEELLPLYIERYFYRNQNSICFWKRLSSVANCHVFGGFLVDILTGNNSHRDIDIVVDYFSQECIDLLCDYNGIRNSFGGFKLDIEGVVIDIWEIKNTWAIKKMNYLDFDLFSILPSTSFFNSTAIIYSLKKRELYFKDSFINYLYNNTLDILFEDNPYPELCILKAYQNQLKGATLSRNLKKYILSRFNGCSERFDKMQLKHFNEVKYNRNELLLWYRKLQDIGEKTEERKKKREIVENNKRKESIHSNQLALF